MAAKPLSFIRDGRMDRCSLNHSKVCCVRLSTSHHCANLMHQLPELEEITKAKIRRLLTTGAISCNEQHQMG